MKNQDFNFEDIGRRMPYKVPEGFFGGKSTFTPDK